jgi:ankyrin repeat protein
MERTIKLNAYILKPLALEAAITSDLLDNMNQLNYGENVILDAEKLLINLLKLSNGEKRHQDQQPESHVLEGIEKMFRVMSFNSAITAAPRQETERKTFYYKLASGFKFLGDIIHEEFTQERLDKKDVYSCLETIGDGGHACAGRWRQVLEEVLVGFSHRIQNTEIAKMVEQDQLKTEMKAMFYKGRLIEGNRGAEEFVKENYPSVNEDSRIHYITFFKRYVNESKNYHLPTTMDSDSYLGSEQKEIEKNIKKYLTETDLDHAVVKRFLALFQWKIKIDDPLFHMVVNDAKKLYHTQNLKTQYDDVSDFLTKKIFKGYSKEIRQDAVLDLLIRKGFVTIGERTVNVLRTTAKLVDTNQLDDLQELFEKLAKDESFPREKLRSLINTRSHKGQGEVLLILAIKETKHPLWRYLLENGVNVNLQNKHGNSALHVAAYHDKKEVVERLLEKGANIDLPNKEGSTSLHFAASKGNMEMVIGLLEKGATLEAKDKHGNTSLDRAIFKRQFQLTKVLLEKGSDVNARNHRGFTPLHRAVKIGDASLIQLMIKHGADLTLKSNEGETALDMAKGNCHKQIEKILLATEAKNTKHKILKPRNASKDLNVVL